MMDSPEIVPKAPGTLQVGERFVEFYVARGYTPIPGSSLLDESVPMSFVMSAGLAQVETSARAHDARRGSRYALVQNCFRYFDLATIGVSGVHLSLFRMPGAFTFGPVNHGEMIAQIWQLLTGCYGLPADRLWVTYFAGDVVAGHRFEADLDTYGAWRQVGVPPERLVGLPASDNFWKQGASVVGERDAPKCGPNTEVFFDRGAHLRCGPDCRPGCRCGRFVEFLNTLFITRHMDSSGRVRPLDEPFTETVVGLERVAMLLQGASTVYELDILEPLVALVQSSCAASRPEEAYLRHVHVMADHIRALLFLTADGAPPPGRGGRARLMRKLVREMITAQKLLGIEGSSFYPLLLDTALRLEAAQQEHLLPVRERLLTWIGAEQTRFENTLQTGQRRLARMLAQGERRELSGEAMVALEKQHGIPFPLLEGMLRAEGATYHLEDYQRAYAHWRCQTAGVPD